MVEEYATALIQRHAFVDCMHVWIQSSDKVYHLQLNAVELNSWRKLFAKITIPLTAPLAEIQARFCQSDAHENCI